MDMPKPGAPHQQLAKLVGTWTGDEVLAPSPYEPKGATATGKVKNSLALDGFIVIQDYEQTRGGVVNFKGHGVFSWDPAGSVYVLHWWDSMGGICQPFTGKFQGDVLTCTGKGEMGHMRVTFDVSKGGYKFGMDMSPDGQKWTTMMTGTYKKGATAAG